MHSDGEAPRQLKRQKQMPSPSPEAVRLDVPAASTPVQPPDNLSLRRPCDADNQPEPAQSSKCRRTADEITTIAARRLQKSQSLYELPSPPSACGADEDPASRRPKRKGAGLFIRGGGLQMTPTTPTPHDHFPNSSAPRIFETFAPFSVQDSVPDSNNIEVFIPVSVQGSVPDLVGNSTNPPFEPNQLDTAKKRRLVEGTADSCSSGAVACTPTFNEEKNPATLRHRPPKIELQGSSPQTPAGGRM